MKLVHVVPHIDQEASGPSYSVPRLCSSLAGLGHEVELSCLAAKGEIAGVALDVRRQWPIMRRFAISSDHLMALRRKAGQVDIVHNHSLWSMVNVGAGWAVPGRGAKLVVSPRGTLSAWALARSRVIKSCLWPLQRRALERADLLHATSKMEYREIRALGLSAPVAIIPNGVDLPDLVPPLSRRSARTMLFLSRIHPKKGVDRLLQAWQALWPRHPDWSLVIAGEGEAAHELEARELARSLALPRVSFPGALFGAAKSQAYFEASLFVLPTHSENFGMVVAEALAHGCPAVVAKGAPWAGLQAEHCGWWIENDVETLIETLDAAMLRSPAELREFGDHGRRWMEREFDWRVVAGQMAEAYRWATGHGGPAASVLED